MNINKRDLQLFFKRLRKAHPKDTKIKYYAAAEFGTKTDRPHYHIIIFNTDIDLISNAWNMGDVHFGQVSAASVGYTLKYINKPTRIPKFKGDDRTPEFALMSKRIGASYITNKMVKWHKADLENRMYCNLTDGKKITMPRYYKEKIYTENERVQISKTAQAKILDSLFEQKTNSTINDSKKIRLDDIRRQHYHANKNTNNKI